MCVRVLMLGWILPGLPSNRSRVTPFSAAPGLGRFGRFGRSDPRQELWKNPAAQRVRKMIVKMMMPRHQGLKPVHGFFGCEISNRGCHVVGQGQDTFKKCVGVCFREFVVIYYIYIIDIQLVDVPFL